MEQIWWKVHRIKMMAVLFRDLQEKQFISHCSKDTTSLEGKARHTEHHEKIKHPQLAEQCLQMAAGIDIHNYARACSSGLCDVQSTKNNTNQQFSGILGFTFSNTFFLAIHFTQNFEQKSINEVCHVHFKIKLTNQVDFFKLADEKPTRSCQ